MIQGASGVASPVFHFFEVLGALLVGGGIAAAAQKSLIQSEKSSFGSMKSSRRGNF
jgi:hypothetical protein